MSEYRINVYWSEEDNVFVAKVPDLPGCMAHGDTRTTALGNAKKAVQAWIDTAREFGDPIPKPKKKRITSPQFTEVKDGSETGKELSLRMRNPQNFSYTKISRTILNPVAR
ncbi:MAG: type II toxin-antitoxin system HicB family antitoxin [Acidobacteria bacterium]|nr:type II toxin-antitoxin system HicB family antitoxin [Acidobacteriota bacterium]